MTTAEPVSPAEAAGGMTAEDAAALDGPFVRALVRLIRAHDTYGAWDTRPDIKLLANFVVTREQRQQIPIIGDPDRATVRRLETFYAAVGLIIEQRSGLIATPMIKLSEEGWGRLILTAGRLVVISRSLREVHRFGFPSLARLAEEGEKLVAEAVAMIEQYPEVARA